MFGKDRSCKLTKDEINDRVENLLKDLTLQEKVLMLNGNWDGIRYTLRHGSSYNPIPIETNGVPRLGISPVKFSDGPRGIVMGKSTCFPVAMARGASFDRELERRIGEAIGKEARAQGANYFGGVCINLLRHPAWGRAQETYSEDPFLLGEMGSALVTGVQKHNVMACLKHYAVNNIENSRFFVDVRADERTMREVYLPHFKKGIDAGAASVMGAYNRFQGEQACESSWLLTDILRKDWGFQGFTISDFYYGIRNMPRAISAGLDIEMPMPIHYNRHLENAVQHGEIPTDLVDLAVQRILRTLLVFENTPDPMDYTPDLVLHPDHTALAQEAAEKSMVLLRNEGGVLPFSTDAKRVLVIGRLADRENTGDHGSSQVHSPYVITPLQGLRNYLGEDTEIIHLSESQIEAARNLAPDVDCVIITAGYDYEDEGEFISYGGILEEYAELFIEGYRNMGKPFKAALIRLLAKLMPVFERHKAGSSGGDRQSLHLKPADAEIIKAVADINPNTVVVLISGSMVMINEWANRVPAVLYSWYSGMEGGRALARILFGEVNPSGKLPFSVPACETHLPYFSNTDPTISYDFYHGYTLLDKQGHKPDYPFGYGLSYTSWTYDNLSVTKTHDLLEITVTIHNTGTRDGEEVVQVYAGMESSRIERQKKLLKGFKKVHVPAGESKVVRIPIKTDELQYFNSERKHWVLEKGRYVLYAGPNSDERQLLQTSITLP